MGRLFRRRKKNVKSVFVSNGYETPKSIVKTSKLKQTQETPKPEPKPVPKKPENQEVIEKVKKELKKFEPIALILSITINCDSCNEQIEILTEDIEIGQLIIGYPKSELMELIFMPKRDIKCPKCGTTKFEKGKRYKIIFEYVNARINKIKEITEF